MNLSTTLAKTFNIQRVFFQASPTRITTKKILSLMLILLTTSMVIRAISIEIIINNFDHQEKYQPVHRIIKGDAAKFYREANAIIKEHKLGKNFWTSGIDYDGSWLYPRIIALYGIITDKINMDGTFIPPDQIKCLFYLQAIIFSLCLLLLFNEFRFIFSLNFSFLTAMIIAIDPMLLQYCYRLFSESVSHSLIILSTVFFFILLRNLKSNFLFQLLLIAILGITLGLNFLQRGITIFWPLIFIFTYTYHVYTQKLPLSRNLTIFLIILGFFHFLPLIGVGYSNKIRAGLFFIKPRQSFQVFHSYLFMNAGIHDKNKAEEQAIKIMVTQAEIPSHCSLSNMNSCIITESQIYKFQKICHQLALESLLKNPLKNSSIVFSYGIKAIAQSFFNPYIFETYLAHYLPYKLDLDTISANDRLQIETHAKIFYRGNTLFRYIYFPLLILGLLLGTVYFRKDSFHIFSLLTVGVFSLTGGLFACPRYLAQNFIFYAIYISLAVQLFYIFAKNVLVKLKSFQTTKTKL